jgi:hypothetical protein
LVLTADLQAFIQATVDSAVKATLESTIKAAADSAVKAQMLSTVKATVQQLVPEIVQRVVAALGLTEQGPREPSSPKRGKRKATGTLPTAEADLETIGKAPARAAPVTGRRRRNAGTVAPSQATEGSTAPLVLASSLPKPFFTADPESPTGTDTMELVEGGLPSGGSP